MWDDSKRKPYFNGEMLIAVLFIVLLVMCGVGISWAIYLQTNASSKDISSARNPTCVAMKIQTYTGGNSSVILTKENIRSWDDICDQEVELRKAFPSGSIPQIPRTPTVTISINNQQYVDCDDEEVEYEYYDDEYDEEDCITPTPKPTKKKTKKSIEQLHDEITSRSTETRDLILGQSK